MRGLRRLFSSIIAIRLLSGVTALDCSAATVEEQLARTSKSSEDRLRQGGSAQWSALHQVDANLTFQFDIYTAKNMRRIDISVVAGSERQPAAQIIERDGRWYVTDDGGRAKYFLYEAPLKLPLLY